MRLKTYTGSDMKSVMAEVRRTLGPDAIIVSIEQGKRVGGVRITAAAEDALPPVEASAPVPERSTLAGENSHGAKEDDASSPMTLGAGIRRHLPPDPALFANDAPAGETAAKSDRKEQAAAEQAERRQTAEEPMPRPKSR
ncbi:MAG: hypothetical protein D6757_09820, partial [Alphaproteobacteria bacterium]